jgi:hypothetical protein
LVIDLGWRLAGTDPGDLAGQALLRIVIEDRILAPTDDIVCRPVDPGVNDHE